MIAWLERYHGRYQGNKTLFDPSAGGDAVSSPATLEVAPYARGLFHGLRYTWSYPTGETTQDGLLLVGENDGGAYGLWIDSWHNGRNLMRLEQRERTGGEQVSLRGTFPVPNGPDWGWTLDLNGLGSELEIVMHVVTPEGETGPAVEARFERVN